MDAYGWVFKLYGRFLCMAIWNKLKFVQYNCFHWTISLFLFACHSLHYEHNTVKYCFFTFNRSISNDQFFLCQVYVWNGTNKQRAVHNKKKLKENLYIYTLKQDLPLSGSLINEANTEIHTRQADLFNLISH